LFVSFVIFLVKKDAKIVAGIAIFRLDTLLSMYRKKEIKETFEK